MGTVPEKVEDQVKRMDAHLREFCDDNQGFIRVALGGVEARLGGRLKKFESRVVAGFQVVDQRLVRIEGDLAAVKADVAAMKSDITVMKADITVMKSDITVMKADITVMKADITQMKADIAGIRGDIAQLTMGLKALVPRHLTTRRQRRARKTRRR